MELYNTENVSAYFVDFQDTTDMDSMDFLNTSLQTLINGTTESPKSKQWACAESLMLMRFISECGISLPFAILGIVGNVLAFVVLCRQKQKLTTTVLLQGLAVVDTFVLLAVILLRSLRYWHICLGGLDSYYGIYAYLFRFIYPGVYVLRMTDTWLITLLTIDRWIAVCKPLHAQRLCTVKVAYKQMAIVIAVAFVFSLPRFFEHQLCEGCTFGFELTPLAKNKYYSIIYKIILFFIAMYLVPMGILAVLNTKLLCALWRADVYRATLAHNERVRSGQNRSITAIVVTVVAVCIFSDLLACSSHLLWSLHYSFKHLAYLENHRRYLSNISNVMITMNSSINFGIYCLCSRNFRTILVRTFRCERSLKRLLTCTHANGRSNSNSTQHTYLSPNISNGSHSSRKKMELVAF